MAKYSAFIPVNAVTPAITITSAFAGSPTLTSDVSVLNVIGIEFFQSCKHTVVGNLSDEFLINLSRHYENCGETETGSFQCESNTGVHVEYQTQKDEMCVVHTQIEFY